MGRTKETELNGIARWYQARLRADDCVAPCDDDFAARYPSLLSMLVNNRIAEDRAVDGARLTVSVNVGDWEMSLWCPGIGTGTKVHSKTFLGGLEALERGLLDGTLPLEVNKKKPPKIRELKKPKEKT
jgi:hypothetical protein